LYEKLRLAELGLKELVFEKSLKGYLNLCRVQKVVNPGILSIVDLSQSSKSKRLYVIDLQKEEVLYNTFVAHGRNSGEEYASSFANLPQSYKSSLGFYLTGDTYNGAHGLSLRLKGFETGINDCAEKRGIVIHGAPYVSSSFIEQYGRLGRSQGCPAVPEELCTPIVNVIKDGTCFFIFYPDSYYLRTSSVLQ
jgi:hypothetical protein